MDLTKVECVLSGVLRDQPGQDILWSFMGGLETMVDRGIYWIQKLKKDSKRGLS